jgi:hypothetical protein
LPQRPVETAIITKSIRKVAAKVLKRVAGDQFGLKNLQNLTDTTLGVLPLMITSPQRRWVDRSSLLIQ